MFGGSGTKLDYFASEDDIDRVMALAESDTVVMRVIAESGFAADNKLDINVPEQRNKVRSLYIKGLQMKRTEYTLVQVSFTADEPERSARVVNTTVRVLEEAYRGFYLARKKAILGSLEKKYKEQDSTIRVLSDTLAVMRDKSGIYDLISPNRNNLVTSAISSKGGDIGKYVEDIQNVEAIKDGIVIDQTRITSLIQQFSTGTGDHELDLFHIITVGRAPLDTKGPGIAIVMIGSILLGLFFSCVYVLLTTYYKILLEVKR